MSEHRRKCSRFEETLDLLYRWKRARPFLTVGGCRYSQSLVWEMIRQVESLVASSSDMKFIEMGQLVLAKLYEVLDQEPPPHFPPIIKTAPRGCFIFY